MKVCIIQTLYSASYEDSEKCYQIECDLINKCDSSMDVIVLPEACDVPAYAKTEEEYKSSVEKYSESLMSLASHTAKRCNAMVFISLSRDNMNSTVCFDRNGNVAGIYRKQHPTNGEIFGRKLEGGYSYEPSVPYILEMEGIRFAFLTCYDFYFYENFAQIARYNPDVIIGCSHQRTDSHRSLDVMSAFCAYNTNTYVLRASVSMGEDSPVGGGSLIACPDGNVLFNMESRVGMECVDIDLKKHFLKPAGYKGKDMPHHEYVEIGRRPWKYRPSGAAVVLPDCLMPYPRICAHRGFNAIAPEGSMAAFGAAIGLGAEEIEFDVRFTKDGVPIALHDRKLERVSNGTGLVSDYTYEELCRFDFGGYRGKEFEKMPPTTVEEILRKFSCHCIMNIHVKETAVRSDDDILALGELIKRYDCEKYVYIMCVDDDMQRKIATLLPHIKRCQGAGKQPMEIVERAIENGCCKVQFYEDYVNQAMINKAHENGLICNYFYADTPEKAQEMLDMGIDTVLTNNYFNISRLIK